MIQVIAPGSEWATAELLVAALNRSGGLHAAALCGPQALVDRPWGASVSVLIHPRSEWAPLIDQALHGQHGPHKLVVLGRLPAELANTLGLRMGSQWPDALWPGVQCPPAPTQGQSASAAHVRYPSTAPRVAQHTPALAVRPFKRFDFADEWNNLGYGAITADGSCWSLAQHATAAKANELAQVWVGDEAVCSYAALWDEPQASLLWFNRAAGPIDSAEWRLVEDYLSCHRPDALPCVPMLSEIPWGFDSAVTMRLDCDEDIESARHLWQVYQGQGVPLSLAIHSKVLADPAQHRLGREVLAQGGALLSHTATHSPNWGGSHETAFLEGQMSIQAIEAATGHRVRYAVSPFHHTPDYARRGLSDAGLLGCIGGIIHNDPDFLMARAGMPPACPTGFIGHSQQCMLHGECMLVDGDPLAVFKAAFDAAHRSGTFFGYLDHPFSARYAYGWAGEAQRAQAHVTLIEHIRQQGQRVCWANATDAMDFLHHRAHTQLLAQGGVSSPHTPCPWPLAVRHQGRHVALSDWAHQPAGARA